MLMNLLFPILQAAFLPQILLSVNHATRTLYRLKFIVIIMFLLVQLAIKQGSIYYIILGVHHI